MGDMDNKEKRDEKSKENFTFLTEEIKEKAINKKLLVKWIIIIAVMGLIFGIISAVSYTVGVHHMKDIIYTKSASQVSFSEDEIPESEIDDDTPGTISVDSIAEEDLSDKNSANVEDEKDNAEEKAEPAVINNINNIVEKVDIGISDYEQLYSYLYEVASEGEKSIVTVTSVASDTDWLSNSYENETMGFGTVIADNRKELLILVDREIMNGANNTYVKFADGTSIEATEKKYDPNIGMSIIAVPLDKISDRAMAEISMAKFGSSRETAIMGKSVIAIGAPMGVKGSIAYGMVTSASSLVQFADTDSHILTTNIYGSTQGSGLLLNLKGEIVGIITNEHRIDGAENLISAYGISDIKKSIERMSNSQDRAYLGVYAIDVSDDIKKDLKIPQGAYVTEIDLDSPAMDCGIQSGDVITMIGTSKIESFSDFKKIMNQSQPGDETVITVSRYAMGKYTEMTLDVTFGLLE